MRETEAVTAEDVEAFWRDGVVCLRGVLPVELLTATHGPFDAALRAQGADLTALAGALGEPSTGTGRFVAGVDHWREQSELRAFACESPLPAIAAALLRATEVYLYEDSALVKEPGTTERTEWHQDLGYFHVDGTQLCTTWCPLDPATGTTGAMRFARGSHLAPVLYRPNLFVSRVSIAGTEGVDVPDVDAGEFEVMTFDLEPGDITVHHARTLHAAGGNLSATRAPAPISVRYCGDDARVRFRPGAPRKEHQRALVDGDRLGGDAHPLVWTSSGGLSNRHR